MQMLEFQNFSLSVRNRCLYCNALWIPYRVVNLRLDLSGAHIPFDEFDKKAAIKQLGFALRATAATIMFLNLSMTHMQLNDEQFIGFCFEGLSHMSRLRSLSFDVSDNCIGNIGANEIQYYLCPTVRDLEWKLRRNCLIDELDLREATGLRNVTLDLSRTNICYLNIPTEVSCLDVNISGSSGWMEKIGENKGKQNLMFSIRIMHSTCNEYSECW